jgi:putative protein kinase ArgK-like GTPase of G3E family
MTAPPAIRAANLSAENLAERLIARDRAALARAITLIESRKPAHQEMARSASALPGFRASASRH